MKNRIIFEATIALCSVLITVPAIAQTAMLKIIRATDANVRTGQQVVAGEVVRTNPARVSGGRFYRGGEVEASLLEWGLKRAILTRNSSLLVRSFGFCFGGGRVLELRVTGETFLSTRQLTHRCSDIRVCFGEKGRGCASLRSQIKAKEMSDGESYSIGVREGMVKGQDYDEKMPPITIPPGYFSIMNPRGIFSAPRKVSKNAGFRIATQTKTIRVIRANEGYKIAVGNEKVNQLQLPSPLPYNIITPLD
ncbi:MAG: hypothetical protein ACRCYP_01585 [Alphaproteobacteria bacterium]